MTQRPLQRSFAGRAFITLFLILAAHSMTETARDALFLSSLPATQLPLMYLLVAGASILAVRLMAGAAVRLGRPTLHVLLSGAAGISCVFWLAARSESRAFLYLLYLWPAVFSSVVVVEFWRIVSDAYTITEAKSVFGRLGAGGTAGAITGSGLAVALSSSASTTSLLLAAGLLLGASVLSCPRRPPTVEKPTRSGSARSSMAGLRAVGSNRYLLGLAVCLLLATITATLADFVFKSIVTRDLPPQRLAQMFGAVSFGIGAATFLLQVTLVGPIIRSLGVPHTLTLLPSAVALAAAPLIGASGVIGALILHVTDGTLRYSVHRAVSDLLYVPLAPNVRAKAKPLIDVLSQRGGQVIGSLGILAGIGLGAGYRTFAVGIVVLGLVMIAVALALRHPYLELFRTMLRKEGMETRLRFPSLDVESLTSLVAAFSSDDEREVVAAMDLVADQGEVRAIPVVMLFHPSRLVVLRALALFERHQRQGFLWAVDRLRSEAPDDEVRAAALSAYARQRGDPSVLVAARSDQHEGVRLAALVALVSGGWLTGSDVARELAETVDNASIAGKESLAKAIQSQPSPLFEDTLVRLAATPDRGVRARAAEAMAQMPSSVFLAPLSAMLSDSSLRDAARRALVAIGRPALDFLAARHDDESLSRGIRIHIPRSISRFAPSEVVPVLWRRFLIEPDEAIRYKILRGLGRLAVQAPEVRPTADAISDAIRAVSREGLRLACWRLRLTSEADTRQPSDIEALLIQFLADKQERTSELIFRLLGLSHPTEDFEQVFRGLRGSRADRASGRELVAAVVHRSEREMLLALIDEPLDPARLAALDDTGAAMNLTYEETLEAITRTSTGALAAIAERRAAEIGFAVSR